MGIDSMCACGRPRPTNDGESGIGLKCPECGGQATMPSIEIDTEELAVKALLQDDEVTSASAPPAPSPTADNVLNQQSPKTPFAAAPRAHKKIKIEYKAHKKSRRPVDIFISPGVMAAISSIIGGGVWFAVLVANDRPALYPMILVMLGAIRLVRGLQGHPEN